MQVDLPLAFLSKAASGSVPCIILLLEAADGKGPKAPGSLEHTDISGMTPLLVAAK